jgi:hypothetical protein
MLKKPSGNDGASEAADAGDKKVHRKEKAESRDERRLSRAVREGSRSMKPSKILM